jgi:hypothetical protein
MSSYQNVYKLLKDFKSWSFEKQVIHGSISHILMTTQIFLWAAMLVFIVFILPFNLNYWVYLVPASLIWAGLRIWLVERIIKRLQDQEFIAFRDSKLSRKRLFFKLKNVPWYDEYLYWKVSTRVTLLCLEHSLDDFIAYLEDETSQKHFKNWIPVTIIGAMAFPVWGEFVAHWYAAIGENDVSKGFEVMIYLLLCSVFLGAIIWGINLLSNKLLLDEVNERKKLIRMLRMMKLES